MRLAKGEWIAFLDSDDVWLPHKTKVMMKVLTENPEIDFLVALRNSERIWFPYKINYKNLAKITLNKLLFRIEGQTSTAIFKRKILINTGLFNENQKYPEDANYWMRISKHNNMFILAEDLVITGAGKKSFGESGLSANLQAMEKGIQKNLKEMYLTKRINFSKYFFFFLFSKLKYLLRIFKSK